MSSDSNPISHANKNRKGFTVAHLNVCSLKNKLEEVTLQLHIESINILTLSETWLTPNIDSAILKIEGYNLYRLDRSKPPNSKQKKGGGLALYTEALCSVDDSIFSHLNTSNPNIEVQIIFVKKGTDKSCIIINTYRPPNGDQLEFQQIINKTLLELHKDRFADIYLLGDLNLDHHNPRKTEFTKNFENLINTFGLTKQITIPTRVTKSNASILDVIYIYGQAKN